MLSVRKISKTLDSLAIKDVSFEVQENQYFVLLGASGAGKSVLLETIAGLIQPDAGQLFLDGKDITNEKMQNRKIGMVFQDSALFPNMTVYGNISYPLKCRKLNSVQIREKVAKIAEDVAVTHLLNRSPTTLSGGESQRVSLARAIVSEPRCLLLDEPLSSLDVKARSQMRGLLRRIHRRGKQSILHVTHDYTEAVSLGTHVAVMEGGTIVQAGTLDEIFLRPKSEFVADFVGIRNFFKGKLENSHDGQGKARRFKIGDLVFSVLTNCDAGSGFVSVRSEDITIYNSNGDIEHPNTSARNNYKGKITDILRAGSGIEVLIDIGLAEPVEVAAMVTADSVKALNLSCGKKVWVSFKASAAKFVEEETPFNNKSQSGNTAT